MELEYRLTHSGVNIGVRLKDAYSLTLCLPTPGGRVFVCLSFLRLCRHLSVYTFGQLFCAICENFD